MNRLLIANRGEIARRIIRAARAEGIVSIAVFSDADADCPHVREADLAVHIGPSPAAESYLNIERIVDAAKRTRADAIHPGYGFLAENSGFAEAVSAAGLTWVGPSADAMRALGDKVQARHVAEQQGIPTLSGADERDGPVDWDDAAQRIGFPVLVKAAAGGGGRGMRVVQRAEDLAEALIGARREAESSFADGTLLLERFLPRARHIEVQVLADSHGNTVHLYERECSVQRRRQKVLEEAPAPGLSPELRERLGDWAVQLASSVGYQGAGTIEFLVDGDDAFFIEMNTRIQVEHPVTEAVTGVDLVRWQLRIAAGERLSLVQSDIVLTGHAIEVRVVSEDPVADWRPCTGTLTRVDIPARRGLRVDGWVEDGSVVGPHYDSLLTKVIAVGRDRDHALQRLSAALRDAWLVGVPNNLAFLRSLLAHDAVRAGSVHTRWLESDSGLPTPPPVDPHLAVVLATGLSATPDAPAVPSGWRLYGRAEQAETWQVGADSVDVTYVAGPRLTVRVGDVEHVVECVSRHAGCAVLSVDGVRRRVRFVPVRADGSAAEHIADGALLYLHWGDGEAVLSRRARLPEPVAADSAADGCVAPTPGTVRAVHVAATDRVEAGSPLITVESMKVEQTLCASASGIVDQVRVAPGDAVAAGQRLVVLTLDEDNPAM